MLRVFSVKEDDTCRLHHIDNLPRSINCVYNMLEVYVTRCEMIPRVSLGNRTISPHKNSSNAE